MTLQDAIAAGFSLARQPEALLFVLFSGACYLLYRGQHRIMGEHHRCVAYQIELLSILLDAVAVLSETSGGKRTREGSDQVMTRARQLMTNQLQRLEAEKNRHP